MTIDRNPPTKLPEKARTGTGVGWSWGAAFAALGTMLAVVAAAAAQPPSAYTWTKVSDAAPYRGSYNFPVFVVRGQMWAFISDAGNWHSADAKTWTRSTLPPSGMNSAYQKYVQFNDAVYSLGTMTGNYLDLHFTSRIMRTTDFARWEVVAAESNLPRRVFYGALVHGGKMWLMGGYDGAQYYDDVWNSPDGVHWTRVVEHAGWSPRNIDMTVSFKNKLWIIGGGVIDGQRDGNPNSKRETWFSDDGARWSRAPDRTGPAWGGMPVLFDGRIWLVGANRNSTFAPSSLVSDDGINWSRVDAPWSPRGAPAVWVVGDRLYMSGGKYSVPVNGQPQFSYRNDVWYMSKTVK